MYKKFSTPTRHAKIYVVVWLIMWITVVRPSKRKGINKGHQEEYIADFDLLLVPIVGLAFWFALHVIANHRLLYIIVEPRSRSVSVSDWFRRR